MALGESPDAARVGVVGRAVVEHGREPEAVGVGQQPGPHDPADVGHPVHAVARPQVTPVAALAEHLDDEAAVHVDGALGPSGRARGVGEHERVLALDRGCAPRPGAPGHQLVPPDVAPFLPGYGLTGVADHDDRAHARRASGGLVGSRLGGHGASAAHEGVDRDQRDRARVLEAACDRARREAREDRHHERADRRHRVVRDHDLGRHRHEQCDRVAAAYAELLQALGAARDLARQLRIGERARAALLVLADDRLDPGVRGVVGPALDARVGEVEPSAAEPARPFRPVRDVEHALVGRLPRESRDPAPTASQKRSGSAVESASNSS